MDISKENQRDFQRTWWTISQLKRFHISSHVVTIHIRKKLSRFATNIPISAFYLVNFYAANLLPYNGLLIWYKLLRCGRKDNDKWYGDQCISSSYAILHCWLCTDTHTFNKTRLALAQHILNGLNSMCLWTYMMGQKFTLAM